MTFVTITYRAEDSLLRLQARSFARHVDPRDVAQIIVIDNGSPRLTPWEVSRLRRSYGPHEKRVSIVRSDEIVRSSATNGWLGQQVLKLAVSDRVGTTWYTLLDAKNHVIRPLRSEDLVADDGRAVGGFHSFANHPLRDRLVRTLDFLGLDHSAIDRFPPTTTPFVMHTDTVRELLRELGDDFASRFASQHLTEFFLYSGWILRRDGSWDALYNGQSLPRPTIWGRASTDAGIRAAIAAAEESDAPIFGVHRRALRRMNRSGLSVLADFWVRHDLMASSAEASRFRVRFLIEHGLAALRTRLLRRRTP